MVTAPFAQVCTCAVVGLCVETRCTARTLLDSIGYLLLAIEKMIASVHCPYGIAKINKYFERSAYV